MHVSRNLSLWRDGKFSLTLLSSTKDSLWSDRSLPHAGASIPAERRNPVMIAISAALTLHTRGLRPPSTQCADVPHSGSPAAAPLQSFPILAISIWFYLMRDCNVRADHSCARSQRSIGGSWSLFAVSSSPFPIHATRRIKAPAMGEDSRGGVVFYSPIHRC